MHLCVQTLALLVTSWPSTSDFCCGSVGQVCTHFHQQGLCPASMHWASFHFLPQVSWLSLHNSSKKWGWGQLHPLGQPYARTQGGSGWVPERTAVASFVHSSELAVVEPCCCPQWLWKRTLLCSHCLTVPIASLTYSGTMVWTPHSGSDCRKIPHKAQCKVLLRWWHAKNDRPYLLCLKLMLDIQPKPLAKPFCWSVFQTTS